MLKSLLRSERLNLFTFSSRLYRDLKQRLNNFAADRVLRASTPTVEERYTEDCDPDSLEDRLVGWRE